jgi:hypothetical protein
MKKTPKEPNALPSELLELVKAGRLPMSTYFLVTVAAAVAPFRNWLRPSELTFIRVALEQALESDPVLETLKARLVRALRERSPPT